MKIATLGVILISVAAILPPSNSWAAFLCFYGALCLLWEALD